MLGSLGPVDEVGAAYRGVRLRVSDLVATSDVDALGRAAPATPEWRRWSPGGDLLEVASYQRGKLHGLARTYQGGKLTREREYVNGTLNGAALEDAIAPGTFEDARVRAWRGAFSEGHATGRWTYRDASGSVLFERDQIKLDAKGEAVVPPKRCSRCSEPLDLDVEKTEYFMFLRGDDD